MVNITIEEVVLKVAAEDAVKAVEVTEEEEKAIKTSEVVGMVDLKIANFATVIVEASTDIQEAKDNVTDIVMDIEIITNKMVSKKTKTEKNNIPMTFEKNRICNT